MHIRANIVIFIEYFSVSFQLLVYISARPNVDRDSSFRFGQHTHTHTAWEANAAAVGTSYHLSGSLAQVAALQFARLSSVRQHYAQLFNVNAFDGHEMPL